MHFIAILLFILLVVFGPQIWAKHVLSKHARPREDLTSTGGELARHLLDRLQLPEVQVEGTDMGDHYDPMEKVVRLSRRHWATNSLTAVVVAAHEVGHAIQDAADWKPFRARTQLVLKGIWIQRIGSILMMAMPLVAILTRSPRLGLLMFLLGLTTLGSSFVIHLITLPVEWDASFRRALPMLADGYIPAEDRGAAKEILTACALTYAATSLASLLNLWRWIAILRR